MIADKNSKVVGYTVNVSMFVIATAMIAKYSETTSRSYAAASVTFLFLYVFA